MKSSYSETDECKVGGIAVRAPLEPEGLPTRRLLNGISCITEGLHVCLVGGLVGELVEQQLSPGRLVIPVKGPGDTRGPGTVLGLCQGQV